MTFAKEKRAELEMVKIRAERKMAEIRHMLVPGCTEPLTAVELAERVARQLGELPPAEREQLRLKAAVAIADLHELAAALTVHLDAIGDELRKLEGHRGASAAYGRWTGGGPRLGH